MTTSVFLQTVIDRIEDQIEQVQEISRDLTVEFLNQKPDRKSWSMAQIFDHMVLGVDLYVPEIKKALISQRRSPAHFEVFHSWFGRIVIKGAGPTSNVPVPKRLLPRGERYRLDIVDRWVERHQEIITLAKQARGIDLSAVSMRNPIFTMLRMNLADYFEVLAAHAERHVGQIEALSRHLPTGTKAEEVGSRG